MSMPRVPYLDMTGVKGRCVSCVSKMSGTSVGFFLVEGIRLRGGGGSRVGMTR